MKYLFVLILSVLLISCKKDTIQYTIKGTIYSNIDASELSDVNVKVFQKPFNNSVTSNSYELVGSTTTDNSGTYSVTFDRERATDFKITLERDGFFDEEILLTSEYINSGADNILNWSLDGESWIKMNIQNAPPSNQSDVLTLTWYIYRTDCSECIENEFNSFNGIVDTSFVHANTAGQHLKFLYNDGNTSTIDSVLMPHHDTVNYSIIF